MFEYDLSAHYTILNSFEHCMRNPDIIKNQRPTVVESKTAIILFWNNRVIPNIAVIVAALASQIVVESI